MRLIARATAAVATILACGVSVACAQHPQVRKGFWIGFGVGWGSYGISCSGCGGLGREDSYTAYVKLGGTVSPHLLLGGELNGWSKTQNGATASAGNATLTAFYYPVPASGLFVNGGVGFSRVEASGGGSSSGKTGPGVTLGAGYDVRVGTNLSITPIANWNYGHPESGFSHNFFQFAVGVTFH